MKSRISLSQYIVVMVIACLLLALVGLFCTGAVYADDGTGTGGADLDALWLAITAVGMTLLNLYWDILKVKLGAIWSVKEDGTAWKLRCSLLALGLAIWDMLKAAYKKGLLDAIISVLVGIIKRKLGLPAAARAVKSRL
jgi:hypothetical protein